MPASPGHAPPPAGTPLPPPDGPPLERELVPAGAGARREPAATTSQITRELPVVERRTPPPVHDHDELTGLTAWTEDRRGRSPILPGLIGVAAAALTIVGLLAVFTRSSDDSPEPQPDGPTPTTVVAVPTTTAPTLPPLTTVPVPAPDPAATTPVDQGTTEPAGAPATTAAPPADAPVSGAVPATSTPARAPATTAAPTASAPAASAPAVDDVVVDEEATATAQGLADALSAGDWAVARRLNPALATMSDAELQRGYGDLADSTVVPVRSDDAGDGRVDLRLGLVAHQQSGANRQTTLYCVTWRIDPAAGTVNPASSAQVLATLTAWVDPGAVTAQIRSSC